VLDAVDTALERTRATIARARELRKSLIAELLSRGVGRNGNVRDPEHSPTQFSKTRLGQLPTNWTLSRAGQEFKIQNGFTINEAQQTHLPKRRYLRVANVQRDALKLDDIQELKAGDAEFAPRVLAVNDLLVVEGHADRMQIGRCARVTEEAAGMTFQNHLFRLRTCGEVTPEFACLWLNSAYAQRFWNACCATSSGLNTINQRMLKRLVVPVAPKPEQEKIAAIIGQQRRHLEALVAKANVFETLKKSLMHDLLMGRVRVKNPKTILQS
jgi:type I restriction enzyme, S subunit